MFIIGYPTEEETIIEQLTNFDGTTMMFKTKHEAEDYVSRLYIKSGVMAKPFEDDGLKIIRVQ